MNKYNIKTGDVIEATTKGDSYFIDGFKSLTITRTEEKRFYYFNTEDQNRAIQCRAYSLVNKLVEKYNGKINP